MPSIDQAPKDQVKRRRWLRFSLRTFFVVITLLCVWLGIQVNAARRQKEATDVIVKAGGIWYDYQMTSSNRLAKLLNSPVRLHPYDLGRNTKYDFDPNALPATPAWLRDQLDADYFRAVVSVDCSQLTSDTAKAKEQLDQLANLPALKQFNFIGGYLSLPLLDPQEIDFSALQHLNQLEVLAIFNYVVDGPVLSKLCDPARLTHLSLSNSNFDDGAIEQVGRMTNLEQLWLNHTRLTDAGLVHLRHLTKLKFLYLNEGEITDAGIKHLTELNRLTHLWIRHTQITDNGIRELQKSLPTTTISSR